MRVRIVAAALLIVSIASAAALAAKPVFATPAEVVAASIAANRANNFEAVLDTQSSACHEQMTKFVVTMISRGRPTTLPADEAAQRDAFMARYHLDNPKPRDGEKPTQAVDRLMAGIPNKRAFLADYGRAQAKHIAKRPAPASRPADPTLTDVVIAPDGHTATGKLVRKDADGSSMSTTLKFVKIDGSWLLDSMMFY